MLTRSLLSPNRSRRYLCYAIVGQHLVGGWSRTVGTMLVDAVDGFQRELGVQGHVAEIGVHHGRLLIQLSLLRRPAENAVGIDVFENQHLNVDNSGRGDRARLRANLHRWDPRAHDVRVTRADSWTVDAERLRELAGGPLRIVSIDGGHTSDLTEHDLATAADALSTGGVIVLDDCFNEIFPGVSEGALAFLSKRDDLRAFLAGGNKTLICQQDWVEPYRSRMLKRLELGSSVPWVPHENVYLGRPFVSIRQLEGWWIFDYWRRYVFGRLRELLHRGG